MKKNNAIISTLLLAAVTVFPAASQAYFVKFGSTLTEITPITSGTQTAVDYYDLSRSSGHPDFGTQNFFSFFWMYEDNLGNISLGMIFADPEPGATGSSSGTARMDIDGLPASASVSLSDDPGELRFFAAPPPPFARGDWVWNNTHTDGGVIALGSDPWNAINFSLLSSSGIDNWRFVSQDITPGSYIFEDIDLAANGEFTIFAQEPIVAAPPVLWLISIGFVGLIGWKRKN